MKTYSSPSPVETDLTSDAINIPILSLDEFIAPSQPPLRKSSSSTAPAKQAPSKSVPTSVPPPLSVPHDSSACPDDAVPHAVTLNVYDVVTQDDPNVIPRLNNLFIHIGLGVFHTGVQVHDKEYAFGGHAHSDSGIFQVSPKQCPLVRYRLSLSLGCTRLTPPQIDDIVTYLGNTQFPGNQYSLISRNCNSFSRAFCTLLGLKNEFPAWVNRLAVVATNFNCLLPAGIDTAIADNNVPISNITQLQTPLPAAIL